MNSSSSLSNHNSTGMITNIPNLGMNYVNYKTAIVHKYHVQLLGWPSNLPFVNPHQLTTSAAASTLQNALTVSTCKWVVMSKRQRQEHTAALAADLQGGQVGKKRKPRSDKGKKRKHALPIADDNDDDDTGENEEEEDATDDDDENERPTPAKKQKLAASSKKPKGPANKSKAGTASSKSKAAAAKKAKRAVRTLPPAALKSKEIIDTEDDSDD